MLSPQPEPPSSEGFRGEPQKPASHQREASCRISRLVVTDHAQNGYLEIVYPEFPATVRVPLKGRFVGLLLTAQRLRDEDTLANLAPDEIGSREYGELADEHCGENATFTADAAQRYVREILSEVKRVVVRKLGNGVTLPLVFVREPRYGAQLACDIPIEFRRRGDRR